MNRIHRVVFNRSTGVHQVVSETASAHSSGAQTSTVCSAPRLSRLAMACLIGVASMGLMPGAALADGGAGGLGYDFAYGGAGGNSLEPAGQIGMSGATFYMGGGGGGGSAMLWGVDAGDGAAGGLGGGDNTGTSGLGGTGGLAGTRTASGSVNFGLGAAGADGQAASSAASGAPALTFGAGGGGGGGGYGAVVIGGTVTVDGPVLGGLGGAGGAGFTSGRQGFGGGGGGGQGGGGLLIVGEEAVVTNASIIVGGSGGAGGAADTADGGSGGDGGAGAVSVAVGAQLRNNGSITGGAGAQGGDSDEFETGFSGRGGAGVSGADLHLVNNGTITGGVGADGQAAHAVEFTSGTNILELHAASVINGTVNAAGESDTLVLGGVDNGNFDLNLLGTGAWTGFEAIGKIGSSTWTLSGDRGPADAFAVQEGTLELGDGDGSVASLRGRDGDGFQDIPLRAAASRAGGDGGAGGSAAEVSGEAALVVGSDSSAVGGNGGDGVNTYTDQPEPVIAGFNGGAGGAAVVLSDNASLDNAGLIAGGDGGSAGDIVVQIYTGPLTRDAGREPMPTEGIQITGGQGGQGGAGVQGDSTADLVNRGDIHGGLGGSGAQISLSNQNDGFDGGNVALGAYAVTVGQGGRGGNGLSQSVAARVDNRSLIAGGDGGSAGLVMAGQQTAGEISVAITSAAGGAGGTGVEFAAGGTLVNSGVVRGGNAGGSSSAFAIGAPYTQQMPASFAASPALAAADAVAPTTALTVSAATGASGGAGVSFGAAGQVQNSGGIQGGHGAGWIDPDAPEAPSGPIFLAGGSLNLGLVADGGDAALQVSVNGNHGGAGGAGVVMAGANSTVANGASGTIAGGAGGTGGTAAALVVSGLDLIDMTSPETSGVLTGTAVATGGNGGQGGAGVQLMAGGVLTNQGTITGGRGGDGGMAVVQRASLSEPTFTRQADAADSGLTLLALGGKGGDGGAAVQASDSVVFNQAGATIRGGDGGASGAGQILTGELFPVELAERNALAAAADTHGYSNGAPGLGGVGISGANLTVHNAGSIAGGFTGVDYNAQPVLLRADADSGQAAAIDFTGGVNTLVLYAGSDISGHVQAFSQDDSLVLGGDNSSSFEVSAIGDAQQYRGFGNFRKTGASTWTLTGAQEGLTPWTVTGGALSISSDASLGDVAGALTLDGGALQTTADIATERNVTLGEAGGTFDTATGSTLTLGVPVLAPTLPQNRAPNPDVTASPEIRGGVISGEGQLTKEGAGTLRLLAANTYQGGTVVNAGTLVGGAASFGSGAIDIATAGTLEIDEAANTTMANTLSGNGSLVKSGAGQVLYTGNGLNFTGTTLISGGVLSVNGNLGGTTTIGAGGTLRGIGTIGTTVMLPGSTVAPGNSIGTLTVAGNYTFALGSTYEVETDAAGNSDRIDVGGTATLNGATVTVLSAPGAYAPATTYTILTSANRVGTFNNTVSSDLAFLDAALVYVGNDVQLTLTRNNINFADVTQTRNQRATAVGVQGLGGGDVFNALVGLSAADTRSALDEVSGELHASARTVLIEDSRFLREAGLDRLRQSQGGSAAGMDVRQGEGGSASWARVFASDGRIDGDGNAGTVNRDVAGVLVGADAPLANGWRAGVTGGYSQSDIDIRGASAKADSYHLGVYGGTQWDATSLRLGASYTWSKLDTRRSVGLLGQRLTADYDAGTAQVFGEIGQRIDMGRYALEPFAGLAHVNVDADGFGESGGSAALRSGGGKEDVTFSTLGVRASTAMTETTRLRGTLGWRHAFGDRTASSTHTLAGSPAFTVYGAPLGRDVAVIEAGVETQLQRNMTLGVSYAGQLGDGQKDHGVKLSLGWKF